jgi:hypothetical protein
MFFGQKNATLDQDLSQNVVVLGPNMVIFCPKNTKWWLLVNLSLKVVVLCY